MRQFKVYAVQPKWKIENFLSSEAFKVWLKEQFTRANPDPQSLIVLTELNALPLVLKDVPLVQHMPKFEWAMAVALLKHAPSVLSHIAKYRIGAVQALHLATLPETLPLYLQTCKALAQKYQCYVLTGTGVFPHLALKSGQVTVKNHTLYNQAILLSPEGHVLAAWDKVFPTKDEFPLGISAGTLTDLAVVPTPVGDLGVATSLDAFKPELIRHLEQKGCTVLLQPDANAGIWTAKEQEIPNQNRDQPEAWLDSAWAAVQQSRIEYAINPMVVGNLFEVPFDGQSAIVGKAEKYPEPKQSYVMTQARGGFIQLMRWVMRSDHLAELRKMGQLLAPNSISPLQNDYVTGVLSSQLTLPAARVPAHTLREFEQALEQVASGAKIPKPAVSKLWGLGIVLILLGIFLRLNRR